MSSEATRWAVSAAPSQLSTAAMCTLLVMADVANPRHDHQVWFERGELARRAHVSIGTVGRALTDLQSVQLIERVPGPDRCPKARTTSPRTVVWRVLCMDMQRAVNARGARLDDPLNARGARRDSNTPLIPLELTADNPPNANARDVADAITRWWWEQTFPRPMLSGGFPAARKIAEHALRAGWKPDEVKGALAKVEGTLMTWKLEEQLAAARKTAHPRPASGGFDNSTPEDGRRW